MKNSNGNKEQTVLIMITTTIQEAPIKSVLNPTLSLDNLQQEKLTVSDDDLKKINLERVRHILDPNCYILGKKRSPIYVPVTLKLFENKQIISQRVKLLPEPLAKTLHDNPQSSIINSILKFNYNNQRTQTQNQINDKLFKNTIDDSTSDFYSSIDSGASSCETSWKNSTRTQIAREFHCRCCEKLKNICTKQYGRTVFKWKSEPNLNISLLQDGNTSDYSSGNYCDLKQTNDSLQSFDNTDSFFNDDPVTNSYSTTTSVKKKPPLIKNMIDQYSIDIDVEQLRRLNRKNVTETVNELNLNIDSLKSGTVELHNDIQEIKNGFQMEQDRVSKLIEDAQKLMADLKDLKYLDDLILMLEGQVDNIQMKPWPFKILNREINGKNFVI